MAEILRVGIQVEGAGGHLTARGQFSVGGVFFSASLSPWVLMVLWTCMQRRMKVWGCAMVEMVAGKGGQATVDRGRDRVGGMQPLRPGFVTPVSSLQPCRSGNGVVCWVGSNLDRGQGLVPVALWKRPAAPPAGSVGCQRGSFGWAWLGHPNTRP